MNDALDRLQGAKYFTTLDLLLGYWQVELDPKDVEKSAFIMPDVLYQFNRLLFGLCNALAAFQHLMDCVIGHLKWTMMFVYLDNIVIYRNTFEEHLYRLSLVLGSLSKANLRLKAKKYYFGYKEDKYLGNVSKQGIKLDPDSFKLNLKALSD